MQGLKMNFFYFEIILGAKSVQFGSCAFDEEVCLDIKDISNIKIIS